MFYPETVSDLLFEFLQRLMNFEELNDFRLVGGTALSLQMGHRTSIDIDMFTDSEYGRVNFDHIEEILSQIFPVTDSQYKGEASIGKSFFIGNTMEEAIKLDLFHTEPFVFEPIEERSIRMASKEEIAAMKLDVIGQGGRKKDFWDIHELLGMYSISGLLYFHSQRYPYSHSETELLESLKDFSTAEDDFTPICLKGKIWELIKLDIEDEVNIYNAPNR